MDLTTAVAEEYRLLKKTAATVDPFTFYARVADRLGYDPLGKKNAALLYAVMKKVPLAEVFRRHGAEKGISYCKKRFADAASLVSSEEYERFLRIFAYAEDPATYPPPDGAASAGSGRGSGTHGKKETGERAKTPKTVRSGDPASGDTVRITERFRSLSVQTALIDVVLRPSINGECAVLFTDMGTIRHSALVTGGVLHVSASEDLRQMQHRLTRTAALPKVTVLLPPVEYDLLQIRSTGNVEVMQGCKFGAARLSVGSGKLRFSASVSGAAEINGGYGEILLDHAALGSLDMTVSSGDVCLRSVGSHANASGRIRINGGFGGVRAEDVSVGSMDITVSSGDVSFRSVRCRDRVQIQTSYGNVRLDDVRCRNLHSEGSSGDITLKQVLATGTIDVERSFGNVRFDGSDAPSIRVTTSSGNVTGTLLTAKTLITNSGYEKRSISMGSGGVCRVDTSYGNVRISFAK